jgi:tRNA dimethylallyltransferase
LAVSIAKRLNTVVVSADSRQFYKQMSIGTAKPTLEEQAGVIHYFIDSHELPDEVTAARFAKEAESLLEQLFEVHQTIVLTGGSGMFVDALIDGLDDIPSSVTTKAELQLQLEKEGLQSLLIELASKDPVFFEQVDRKNPMRIMRALEAIRLSNRPYSELRTNTTKKKYNTKRFILQHPRERLYERINRRVDLMIEEGLIDEVRSLLPYRQLFALRTVGYKEIFAFFDGKHDLKTAIELIKQHTRNYAKRQITWTKRYQDAVFIDYTVIDDMTNLILRSIASDALIDQTQELE